MIKEFPRSSTEISNLFESDLSLFRRSDCVVLYIPRVGDARYLVELV